MKKVILSLLIAALLTSSTVVLSSCKKAAVENDTVSTEQVQTDDTSDIVADTSDIVEETEDTDEETKGDANAVPSGNAAYTLTKVGTIKDEDMSISIAKDAVMLPGEDSMFRILTYLGEDAYGMDFDSHEYLGNGYYCVRTDDMTFSYGVIDNKGNMIIDCDAAILRTMSERYLYVAYVTEQTDNEDECFLYGKVKSSLTLEAQSPGLSVPNTENGDVMYKGYAKVYDLKEMRFVPNVEIGRNTIVKACGDCFFVKEDGGYGKATLYNSEGASVWSIDDNHVNIIANGIFGNAVVGTMQFYDTTGKELWTSDTSSSNIDLIESHSDSVYLSVKTDDGYYIVDRNGNKLSDNIYSHINSECDGIFCVSKDNKALLIDEEGNEIASLADVRSTFTYQSDGIWEAQKNDMSYVIADKNGIIAENIYKFDDIYADGENRALIYNDGEFTYGLENKKCERLLNKNLISIYDVDENGEKVYTKYNESQSAAMIGVADMNTGETLLPCKYRTVKYAAGYLYAYDCIEELWEIYQVELNA